MVKYKVIGLSILCVLTLLCGISHAGVAGSKHDLGINGGTGFQFLTPQVCVFCHTPHNTNVNALNQGTYYTYPGPTQNSATGSLLLWNRALSQQTSYLPYTSSTMDVWDTETPEMRVYSLMCLGCHDGVGALNVVNNYPSSPGIGAGPMPCSPPGTCTTTEQDQIGDVSYFGGGPNIGEDDPASPLGTLHLENDHPVSFDYQKSIDNGDSGLNTITNPSLPNAYVTNPEVRLFWDHARSAYTSLECSSCHNPHDDGVASGKEPFLVMSNDDSALCVSCHKK